MTTSFSHSSTISRPSRFYALVILALMVVMSATAQEPDKRHVTPVKPETNRVQPPPKGTNEKIIQQYISGDSAAAVAEARKDSLRRIYKHYPPLNDISFGINFIEPLFMALGQTYASTDVSATLNMWNRLQPTVEIGLGWAKTTPDGMNFTYRGKISPYFKIGANYNFLFKSNPDYQALVGLRLGYSTFRYDITDISYANSYWDEFIFTHIKGERSHALWGEAAAGIKVKIWNNLSLGWLLRYHGIFNYGKNKNSRPWFIPGYGPKNSSLGISLSLYYILPWHREKPAATQPDNIPQP